MNIAAANLAITRLRDIQEFEQAVKVEGPKAKWKILLPNKSEYSAFTIGGDSNPGTKKIPVAEDIVTDRKILGDGYVKQAILLALGEAKKELCTALHDLGVDINELSKELNL